MDEDIRRIVKDEIKYQLEDIAEYQAATSWSHPDTIFGKTAKERDKTKAQFGDHTAIDGEVIDDRGKLRKELEDYEYADIDAGGRVPNTEQEIGADTVVDAVMEHIGVDVSREDVYDIMEEEYGVDNGYIYFSVSGHVTHYVEA